MLFAVIRSLLKKLGRQKIVPTPPPHPWDIDGFTTQKYLMKDRSVKTIFDVGANSGQSTTEYRKLFPEATIHSFEPDPEPYGQLCNAFEDNPHVLPHLLALSDQPGTAPFHINRASPTNSFLKNAPNVDRWLGHQIAIDLTTPVKTIDVDVTTIDAYCRDNGIDEIQILKTDTQGFDLNVLRGATHMLEQKKIDLIYCELLMVPVYENQCYYYEIASFLNQYNYRLYNIYTISTSHTGHARWADGLFIRPQLDEPYSQSD